MQKRAKKGSDTENGNEGLSGARQPVSGRLSFAQISLVSLDAGLIRLVTVEIIHSVSAFVIRGLNRKCGEAEARTKTQSEERSEAGGSGGGTARSVVGEGE
jgi:hypothetical protein